MNLEGFKECFGDKKPRERLYLLVMQLDTKANDRVAYHREENPETKEYYRREVAAMDDRIDWLYDGLIADLTRLEELEEKNDLDRGSGAGQGSDVQRTGETADFSRAMVGKVDTGAGTGV